MMVVVSWEMQSSVMGDAGLMGNLGLTWKCWSPHDGASLMGNAGLMGNLGLTWRCWSPHDGNSLMGDAGLCHGKCRTHWKLVPHLKMLVSPWWYYSQGRCRAQSWEMQDTLETWASPEGAGLPMMVVVSREMQGSVMGMQGPFETWASLKVLVFLWWYSIILIGYSELSHGKCRANWKLGPQWRC